MTRAVATYGRFNVPTEEGHGTLLKAVQAHAEKTGASHYVFPSHSQDAKKNPLNHNQKVGFMRRLFPNANIVSHKGVRTVIDAMKHLESKGHTHVTMVVGSDRVDEFHGLLNKYRKKEYPGIKSVKVVSGGQRDPDAEGAEGMSASKLRDLIRKGKRKEFISHYSDSKLGAQIHDTAKKAMSEQTELNKSKAVFLVGGPGSGKDFLIHSVFSEHKLLELSLEKLIKAINEQKNIIELDDFPNLIVNGTAETKEKIELAKTVLESMGYDISMVFVYTTDEVSRNRNNFRLMKGSRTFNEEVRKKRYNESISYLNSYCEMFDTFFIYDNSTNISAVNEERKTEIGGWLRELSDGIERFLNEKVLEVGTDDTANFIKHLTPGQVSNEVNSYAEAESKAKKNLKHLLAKKEGMFGDVRKGGISIARSSEPTNEQKASEEKNDENQNGKKKKFVSVSKTNLAKTGMSSYFDSRMGAVPTGGIGLTSTAVQ
jgi:predicted ABC-type ATPase